MQSTRPQQSLSSRCYSHVPKRFPISLAPVPKVVFSFRPSRSRRSKWALLSWTWDRGVKYARKLTFFHLGRRWVLYSSGGGKINIKFLACAIVDKIALWDFNCSQLKENFRIRWTMDIFLYSQIAHSNALHPQYTRQALNCDSLNYQMSQILVF